MASKWPTKATGRKRNYRREYDQYHGRPEQIRRRAGRVMARRKMVRAGLARKGDGRDVAHRNNNPRDNRRSNLRMASRRSNRGHGRG